MKFLLLGHFAFDVVPHGEAPPRESYGGIFHAVRTIASLSGGKDAVLPVFGVGKSDFPEVLRTLEALPGVEGGGVFAIDTPTPRVYHRWGGDRYTVECSADVADPIPFEKVKRYLAVDGICINMVSGRDMTLETMDEIRMAVRPERVPIHFDFHNLTLAFREKGRRERIPLPEWRRWAFMVQTIQLNEEELSSLTVERLREEQAVGHLLTLGVRGVVVTRGARGATLYSDVHKHTVREDVVAEERGGVIGLGAGDVFGAAFLYEAVRSGDPSAALRSANHAASEFLRTAAGADTHSETP